MGQLWRTDDSFRPPALRRETRIPMPSARRPVLMVAATMAVIFLAASIDAMLWQHSQQRRDLRQQATTLEMANESLRTELEYTREEASQLRRQLDDARTHISDFHGFTLAEDYPADLDRHLLEGSCPTDDPTPHLASP